ncbi:hypothetical protein KY345_05535, partial [Candidatus Woesearchaeota archaeon]|nr:hypothetical protein [Candidatus Woesearchaeota archaeon]
MNKRIIFGINILILAVFSLVVSSQQQTLPDYLREEDGWISREISGEKFYESPDQNVVIHVGDGRGTVYLYEEGVGMVPKDLVLNPGRDSLTYSNGRVDVVDVEGGLGGEQYKVVSTTINIQDSGYTSLSDTAYVPEIPDPNQYLGTAKTSINLDEVYMDSDISPTAVRIGEDIMAIKRQAVAVLGQEGPIEKVVVIPQKMESWEIRDFIETNYGVEVPEDVEINNAYLKDIAAQMGRDPDNVVLDTQMMDTIAEIYIPETNSAGAAAARLEENRDAADNVISDPSSIVEGTLTSSSFNLQGADDPNTLEGEYYTNEEGNRVFV